MPTIELNQILFASTLTTFHQFGLSHLAAVAICFLCGAAVIMSVRRHPTHERSISRLLGILSLAALPGSILATLATTPDATWQELLPLHFCDIMLIVAAISLFYPSQAACSCTYFCSLAATTQALITPSLQYDFPAPVYFSFFFCHGIVVLIALYHPLVRHWISSETGKYISQLFGILYLITIHPINMAFGFNFGFTMHPPSSASILTLLGAWPWYMFTMQIPAFIIFYLLDLPFRSQRAKRSSVSMKK